jgi:Cu2+-exporting ATPase
MDLSSVFEKKWGILIKKESQTLINQRLKIPRDYVKKLEENNMEKTMKIEGMMCGHCEAAVKKALEEIPQVAAAEVSHTEGTAKVTLKENVDAEVLKKAVEDKDYKVLEIIE